MTLTQTVEIPASRRLHLDFDVPREVPTGRVDVVIRFSIGGKTQQQQRTERETLQERVRRYVDEQTRTAKTNLSLNTRGRGCLKGKIWMADDFCEPLEDFGDYM